ncbi:MAG TPA: serine hydrolase [Streptosporangiaceae bacterium]|nr:serine hydrolase [Streptosporangiaceae bacterium]
MSLERDPGAQGVPVTVRNWQDPPFNRWAFWHVGEILPSYRVARGGGPARSLPAAAASDPLAVAVTRIDGSAGTAGEILENAFTDAYVVVQDGELVTEWYGPLGAPDRAHALMSVSKSVLGCVAAVLIDRGQLDADREVTSYVPELAASGYAGATVRHVLDMRSGVRFVEEYANPQADIRRLDEWIGWQSDGHGGEPRGLYPFLTTLQAEAPHGARFQYRSAESDVLGWACERAAGQPMPELISALVWAPMGAEHDARLLRDGLGTAVHDGGLCATARDVARFGQMLLDGGTVPDGAGGARRVIPPRWLRQAWAVDADVRTAFAASPAEAAFPGGWYRNQFWFRPGAHGDVLLCLGIHGQVLHVSHRTRTVCVKLSSWPRAQDPAYLEDVLRAFDAIGGMLAGRDPVNPAHHPHGPAGVVSGLNRHGDTVPPSGPWQPNVI